MLHSNRDTRVSKTLQQGFSLVEIMLALTLASVVLAVGFQLLALGNQLSARTEVLLSANSIAFAKIQEYENKTFDNISVGVPANSYEIEDFTANLQSASNGLIDKGSAKVFSEYVPGSESLKKLRVVIEFNYGNRLRKIEYGTYVQLGGVGR